MTELANFRREIRNAAAQNRKAMPDASGRQSPYGAMYSRVMPRVQNVSFEETFRNWSGICINKRAASFAAVQSYTTRNGETVKEPLLENLLASPNDTQTWYDIRGLASKWRDARGNAYIWTPTLGTKAPLFAYTLPATSVTAILNKGVRGASITHYEYTNGDGEIIRIATNEMLHWRCFAPSKIEAENWVIGQPAELLAAANGVLNDEERQRFLNDYYAASATPPFIITTEDDLPGTPADSDTIMAGSFEEFQQRLRLTLPEAYKPLAILDGGKKLVPLDSATGTANLSGSNPDEEIRRRIAASFNIPLAQITGEDENRANGQNNTARYYADAIDPMAFSFESAATKHFGQWFPDLVFTHKPYVFRDELLVSQQLEFAAQQGYITNEEWLQLTGIRQMMTTAGL